MVPTALFDRKQIPAAQRCEANSRKTDEYLLFIGAISDDVTNIFPEALRFRLQLYQTMPWRLKSARHTDISSFRPESSIVRLKEF